jgi:hypothetical protein
LTAMTQSAGWLDDAAEVVHLPGEAGDIAAAAREVPRLLARGAAGQRAREIIDMPEWAERMPTWREFIQKYADNRESFNVFAYAPASVLRNFPESIDELHQWSTLVELYEAWSDVVTANGLGWLGTRSARIGAAYFARTRWLLLSLPFRARWEGRIAELDLLRIEDGSGRLVTMTRQARDDWLEALGQIDDYTWLKHDIDVEREATEIAALTVTHERLRQANPSMSLGLGRQQRAVDLAGQAVSGYVISRLLLPRFALCRVWRLVYGAAGRKTRVLGLTAAAVCAGTLIALIVGLATPATGVLRWVPLGALTWYALIAVSAAVEPATAWPWLMRQPASSIVGLVAVIPAPAEWWHDSGTQWRAVLYAALLMTGAGVGYLFFEAGNQDVRDWWPRIRRSMAVAGFGYLHALMVALIGLRFLLPEFAPHATADSKKRHDPTQLSCWWHASGCGAHAMPSWLILIAAASWCFAAAVFLQIIWDDQPVTAPLAHVSWRKGS